MAPVGPPQLPAAQIPSAPPRQARLMHLHGRAMHAQTMLPATSECCACLVLRFDGPLATTG